ncbi:RNA-directed DNA polymerase, eukaryota, reverse transcriptase zinc-binding domain protein [Tanacetum coccineum]
MKCRIFLRLCLLLISQIYLTLKICGILVSNMGMSLMLISLTEDPKQSPHTEMENKPALVLDNSCLNQHDYSNFLMGKVKDFASLSNLKVVLASNDFIIDGRVTWVEIEGIPLKMWSENTFNRIASIWGTLLHVEDQEDECYHRKRICINTNVKSNIFESFKAIYQGKVFWVRAKEIPGWVPDFMEDDNEESDMDDAINEEESNGEDVDFKKFSASEGDNENEVVPDSMFEDELHEIDGEEVYVGQNKFEVSPKDSNEVTEERPNTSNESKRVSGEGVYSFQEEDTGVKKHGSKKKAKDDVVESMCPGHFQKAETPRSGGFILQSMDDMVKELTGKRLLWDYLSLVMEKWNGEVIIMGDFNEVRKKAERFGSVFNVQGADAFNMFISNAGLEEVPLGGCSFTWCHKSANKMSKLDLFLISESLLSLCPNISVVSLDRYLSDHRSILMRESYYDYGHVPFRFFHYWFDMEGFDKLVEESWKAAPVADTIAIIKMMKKLKYLKENIHKGEGDEDVVNKRANVDRSLQELEKLQSVEVAQKAKIKWAIKGDENSNLVNESKKKQSLVFKVDFEKAYDLVRWDYLDDILRNFGLGDKWRVWIKNFLRSSRGSVIVNGSPTEEFQIYKGLKQRDPLSPFLFILVMESLQVSFQRVVDVGMFNGISSDMSLYLSHMFYADDAIFVGQWNESNINTIVHVLDCFHRASGLRINMSKIKLLGIYVDADNVDQAVRKIGCVTLQTPIKYLRSKVGGFMSRIQSWNETGEGRGGKMGGSDDKFSQMLTQYESTPEFGSGSGGCGDDEMADDEVGGEDVEDEEDGDS